MPKVKYSKGKDGRYRTTISTGKWDENGKPILIRLSSRKSSADLERMVREYKYELEHGTKLIPTKGSFKEYAQEWLDKYKANRSIKTKDMYQSLIDKYLGDFGEMTLSNISNRHIQQLINNLSDKPRIAQQMKCMINQVFKTAVLNQIIAVNPCIMIETPKTVRGNAEKRIITSEEKVLIRNVQCDPMRKAFLHTLYGTGMRPSEAIALTWEDVNFTEGTISITKAVKYSHQKPIEVGYPKTDKSIRTIPVPNIVLTSLKEYQDTLDDLTGYIFAENGRIQRYDTYVNYFYSALASALGYTSALKAKKETGIMLYTMRHNFCTECRVAGISIESCKLLMGHSSARMILNIYSHYAQVEEVKSKINRMNL